MAGMAAMDEDEPISQINIIPFVDIVLVLLIIFMVTSAAIVRASIKVALPQAASGGAEVESTLNIVLNVEGELWVNGVQTDFDGLAQTTKSLSATDDKVQAVIAADKGVPYGQVVSVIDVVKQNGIAAFALNIERGSPDLSTGSSQKPQPPQGDSSDAAPIQP